MFARLLRCAALLSVFSAALLAQETFVGSFAEPTDGGNLDTTLSTFDGTTVTIVPRAHASEAVGGGTRWRNVLFAIRGVKGLSPVFRLPLISPGTGKMILSGDAVSFQNIKLVWSYQANTSSWNSFDRFARTGSTSSKWTVEASNNAPFTEDVVYVSINEHFPVSDFYEWLEAQVFTNSLVRPTPSESVPGSFVIGYQSGAPASAAFSRAIPDMPLFGFVIRDPAATGTKLVVLVSGQHPYEGQNKMALQGAVEWILHSTSDEAKAYRAHYTTVVYPFVNPTGELAGLWRGTAYQPSKDTNRNWDTTETLPARNRGIDTVIVHKNAMKRDIAALALGEPYAVFDYHQNFGDRPSTPDYVLHSTYAADGPTARRAALSDFDPYFGRLTALSPVADMPSDLSTQETLRGLMQARGVVLPLTFERSVYHDRASEAVFGVASVKALVDPTMLASTPGLVDSEPTDPTSSLQNPDTGTGSLTPDQPETPPTPVNPPTSDNPTIPTDGTILTSDNFVGNGSLSSHTPQPTVSSANWQVEAGAFTLDPAGKVSATNSGRAVIETGSADGVVQATLTLCTNGAGVVLRSSDRLNFLRLTLSRSGWFLQRTANGVTATIAQGVASYAFDQKHDVRVSLAGSHIGIEIDRALVRSAEESFNQSATRHGLVCSNTGYRAWENFSVRR
jgi:hypothetical protein